MGCGADGLMPYKGKIEDEAVNSKGCIDADDEVGQSGLAKGSLEVPHHSPL